MNSSQDRIAFISHIILNNDKVLQWPYALFQGSTPAIPFSKYIYIIYMHTLQVTIINRNIILQYDVRVYVCLCAYVCVWDSISSHF